ncbi:hypothetical protein ACPPVQ_00250 [Diaminobutyricibacter sp. McL0618]|uniref:hypothetical protein n=1 Tax=Leifsonia sp. McL0618 TaxID=3415677 RepID=UPI003CF1C83F
MTSTVLVIGASGILAPLAAELTGSGVRVDGIARHVTRMPDGVEPLAVDARNTDSLAAATGGRRWASAVVYSPAISSTSLALIRSKVDGRLVIVRPSAAADPRLGALQVPDDTLQLGWHVQPPGGARWHTPEEVSVAALAVLRDGIGRTLGQVRPWEDRP